MSGANLKDFHNKVYMWILMVTTEDVKFMLFKCLKSGWRELSITEVFVMVPLLDKPTLASTNEYYS